MLILKKNSTNIWAVQVQEFAVQNEYYFNFRQLQTQEVTTVALEPQTTTEKYTRFEIDEPTDLVLGVGEYEYKIFKEITEETLLEVGKLRVI